MTYPIVEISSDEALAALVRLAELGRDPRDAFEAIGRVMKTKVQLGFHNSTDPYGRPWAPLKWRSGQPLRNSSAGGLMDSFDYQVDADGVEIGTNKPYAPTHQHGATIRPKSNDPKSRLRFMVNGAPVFAREVTIPAREMLPLDGLPRDWEEDVVDAVEGVISSRWG